MVAPGDIVAATTLSSDLTGVERIGGVGESERSASQAKAKAAVPAGGSLVSY